MNNFIRLEYNIDSSNLLVINTGLKFVSLKNSQISRYASLDSATNLINDGIIQNLESSSSSSSWLELRFARKSRKVGRTLDIHLNLHYNPSQAKTYNVSNNRFTQQSGEERLDSINQLIDLNEKGTTAAVSITYIEPVFRNIFIELSYKHQPEYNSSDKRTLDFNSEKGMYNIYNDSLSNNFKYLFSYNQWNLGFSKKGSKYDFKTGLYFMSTRIRSENISLKSELNRNGSYLLGFMSFSYLISPSGKLKILYGQSILQPTVEQLQPVPDNRNPLFIRLGNTDIKPTYNHNIVLEYNTFRQKDTRNFYFNIQGNIPRNKIVDTYTLDSSGRQISKPVNVNGTYNITGNMFGAFPFFNQKYILKSSTSFSLNRDKSYANDIPFLTRNFTFDQALDGEYSYKQLLFIEAALGGHYERARYSPGNVQNIDYLTYAFSLNVSLDLPMGLSLGVNWGNMGNRGRQDGYNLSLVRLNGFISKNLFRKKQALIKISGFDLLNQNQSLKRNAGPNYIEDVRSTVLQRYILLSLTWFLKPGSSK